MILTQTRTRRTFAGSINAGTDFIEGLKSICVDNTIFCGVFTAVGYIKNPELRNYDAARKRYRDSRRYDGTFHAVSLNGNISLRDRQTIVQCHTIGSVETGDDDARMISGELVSGEVISVEFTLGTLDDIRLYRADDERTGLEPWLHVEFGQTAKDKPREDPIPDAVKQAAAAPSRTDRGEDDAQESFEVNDGDFINHPTLGRCEVLANDGDERLTIKLASGRQVELHLGLLELTPIRKEGDAQVYKVSIRRRNR